jgi:hypothetical protein
MFNQKDLWDSEKTFAFMEKKNQFRYLKKQLNLIFNQEK